MSSNADLDLTEFVSKLIQDTFNAITITSKDQAEVYYELKRLASLDFDVFREKYILQSDVDTKLLELFPFEKGAEGLHAINVGLPYLYDNEKKQELPSLENNLDYVTSDTQKKSKFLTSETVAEIYALVKDLLAKQQYTSFQDIMSRGIPRVMIDSGRILAKISLNCSVTEDIEEPSISTAKMNATDSLSKPNVAENITMTNLKNKYLHSSIAAKLAKTRVEVSIPNPTNETTSINSNLWGEIEIKFKAVD